MLTDTIYLALQLARVALVAGTIYAITYTTMSF